MECNRAGEDYDAFTRPNGTLQDTPVFPKKKTLSKVLFDTPVLIYTHRYGPTDLQLVSRWTPRRHWRGLIEANTASFSFFDDIKPTKKEREFVKYRG